MGTRAWKRPCEKKNRKQGFSQIPRCLHCSRLIHHFTRPSQYICAISFKRRLFSRLRGRNRGWLGHSERPSFFGLPTKARGANNCFPMKYSPPFFFSLRAIILKRFLNLKKKIISRLHFKIPSTRYRIFVIRIKSLDPTHFSYSQADVKKNFFIIELVDSRTLAWPCNTRNLLF